MAGRRIRTGRVFVFAVAMLIILSMYVMSLSVPEEKSKIYLVSTNGTSRDSLELAKKGLLNIYSNFSEVYVTNVTIPLPVPKRAEENQYLTYDFRDDLADAKRMLGADYLILVTDVDIYAGDRWAYVFGEALVNDGVAIVSYHRLRQGYWKQRGIFGLYGDYGTWLPDTVAHEMGHLVGYRHSSDPDSVMYYEPGPVDLREKPARFNAIEAKELPKRFVKSSFYRNKDAVFSFFAAMLVFALIFYTAAKIDVRIVAASFVSPALPYLVTLLPLGRKLETVIFAHFDPINMILVFALSVFYLNHVDARHHIIGWIEAFTSIFVGAVFLLGFGRIDAMIIGYFSALICLALAGKMTEDKRRGEPSAG